MTKNQLIEALMVIELAAHTQRYSIENSCPDEIRHKILDRFIKLIDCELSHIKVYVSDSK
jgi:hypothetical protein